MVINVEGCISVFKYVLWYCWWDVVVFLGKFDSVVVEFSCRGYLRLWVLNSLIFLFWKYKLNEEDWDMYIV